MGRGRDILENEWCILRTASRSTLGLAASLAKDGFDVWTPVETRTMRVPRMNIKRAVRLPIMPSYVFAGARHLVDLLQLAQMPVKPRRGPGLREPAHASFSVLHWFDRIPLVAERDLTRLRFIEAKRTPVKKKKADKVFPIGLRVRVSADGSWSHGGLRGIVERSDRGHTVVCFNGRYVVKIATSLLNADEVSGLELAAQEAA